MSDLLKSHYLLWSLHAEAWGSLRLSWLDWTNHSLPEQTLSPWPGGWLLPWQEAVPTCLPSSSPTLLAPSAARREQGMAMHRAVSDWLYLACSRNIIPECSQILAGTLQGTRLRDQISGTSLLVARKQNQMQLWRKMVEKGKNNRSFKIKLELFLNVVFIRYFYTTVFYVFSHKVIGLLEGVGRREPQ